MSMPEWHSLTQAMATGALLGGLFALSALGLSLVLGVMRLVNLVHGELVVLGSYLAYILMSWLGLDPLAAIPIVFVVAGGLAFVLQRLLLAPVALHGEEGPLLTTFAVSIVLQTAFIQVFSGDTRSLDRPYARSSFEVAGITVPVVYLIGFAVSMGITALVYLVVHRTGFGRRVRASAEDSGAAAIVGVPVARIHGLTYGLGAGLAAVGGILIALCFSFTPTSGTEYLLIGFTIVVLGGLGSVIGTFAGGMALGILQSIGAVILGDGYRTFVGLILFLLILALRPQGLFQRGVRS